MNAQILANAHEICNRVIIVSGCARSGTTLLGTILYSMESVEYCYEPLTLTSLVPLVDRIGDQEWKSLYATYLYGEVLINAVCGRGLNCNRADDSSVYRAKSATFIEGRLRKSKGMREAIIEARGNRVVFKLPDIVPYLPKILEYYPGTMCVLMHRNANGTISSVLKKGWFSEESLREGTLLWSNKEVDGFHVPCWVREEDIDRWNHCSELERAAYYYIRMVSAFAAVKNRIVVSYDKLLNDPARLVKMVASKLGLAYGERTAELISSVRRADSSGADCLSLLDLEARAEVERFSNLY